MPSLIKIRRRIRSVESLEQLTRAVKMVAAVKVKRARSQVLDFRPYADELGKAVARLIPRAVGIDHPLFARRPPRKFRALVITSDTGLCGGFNTNVTREAMAFREEHAQAEVSFALIGHKGITFMRTHHIPVEETYEEIYDKLSYTTVSAIADRIIEEYVSERIDAYYLIYTLFLGSLIQRPIRRQILPFELAELVREAELLKKRSPEDERTSIPVEEDTSDHYIAEPALEELCDTLLARHLATTLFRALLESRASEFASRMNAMDNASKNATDMIASLTLRYHRLRQEAITTEMTEIAAGAEAMK